MKIYCQECGAKIEFLVKNKPKFCHHCGISLSKSDKSTTASSIVDHEIEHEKDPQKLPNIDGLDVEIMPGKIVGEKMESIMGTSTKNSMDDSPRPVNTQSTEDFLNEFKKEAGSLRDQGKSPDSSPPK